ncbi:MAG: Cof-type HAD-IIB family hydrolase [Ignavibacteriaceae bacterium]|nr:Cof-type HAD-IIB family hydrolase [Ignavibacteriaceae bacterium]
MISPETLRKLQLIIFDLDGTLLKNDGNIGAETKKLVKELQKRGVQFSFATGRLHSAITKYAEELEITTPLISLDGCLIKNHPEGKILFESFVPVKYVSLVLRYSKNYTVYVALCHDDAIFYTERNSFIPELMDKHGAKYEQVESYDNYIHETLEVVLAANSFTVINSIRNAVSFPFLSRVNTSFFQSHSYPGIYYLEIRKRGSSKGKGLDRLIRSLNISKSSTAVVCDWYNDISLLQKSVTKIAMKNAVAEVKEQSDFVTSKSNNEDGVAEFLEQVLKSKSS